MTDSTSRIEKKAQKHAANRDSVATNSDQLLATDVELAAMGQHLTNLQFNINSREDAQEYREARQNYREAEKEHRQTLKDDQLHQKDDGHYKIKGGFRNDGVVIHGEADITIETGQGRDVGVVATEAETQSTLRGNRGNDILAATGQGHATLVGDKGSDVFLVRGENQTTLKTGFDGRMGRRDIADIENGGDVHIEGAGRGSESMNVTLHGETREEGQDAQQLRLNNVGKKSRIMVETPEGETLSRKELRQATDRVPHHEREGRYRFETNIDFDHDGHTDLTIQSSHRPKFKSHVPNHQEKRVELAEAEITATAARLEEHGIIPQEMLEELQQNLQGASAQDARETQAPSDSPAHSPSAPSTNNANLSRR